MSGLTVRTFARNEIDLPVEFVICDEHREQVRFSPTSGTERQFAVRGRTVDVSRGGIGLATRHYLPRMCEGMLRVFRAGDGGDGASADEAPAFEHRVRVCRVSMESPEPTYFVGLAFVNPADGLHDLVSQLLAPTAQDDGQPPDSQPMEDRGHA